MKDEEVILMALGKERQELHERIMQLDRIIKRVKTGEYAGDKVINTQDKGYNLNTPETPQSFPKTADLRIQVLTVFDILKKASKLQDIQNEYNKLNGNTYPIRDTIRGLQGQKLLVMIKIKNASRGFLWAKKEWIENNRLLDEYKPEGFDLLYKPENLIFE